MINNFTYEILLFDKDKGFNVLYTPSDNDCSPISQWIKPPPLENESEILDQISKAAPHGDWERQKAEKNIDQTVYEKLVGKSILATVNNSEPLTTQNPFESTTAQDIRSNII